MQINIAKLSEVAEEYKIATLKAEEFGINGYAKYSDQFSLTEEGFRKLSSGRDYTVRRFGSCYKYEYQTKVDGVAFYLLTNELLFEGDENKIAEDK